jgi:CRISPR/Cas system CSM-associated protein Csm3 (group 7 of RAMP superfamily)
MARLSKLSRGPYRIEITCPLTFLGPLHVGTGERLSVLTDAPILRDANGDAYLPGSSIRGVLRDWCEREAPLLGIETLVVDRLFGSIPQGRKATPDNDRQGRLTVLDAKLQGMRSEVRDHVRISREWGAAEHGAKFDQEIVHCSGANLQLIYEGEKDDSQEHVLLAAVVKALEDGLLSFGGKTGWGLGWAECKKADWQYVDREDPEQLVAQLRRRLGGAKGAQAYTAPPLNYSPRFEASAPCAWSWLHLTLDLQFDGPMLVAGPPRLQPPPGTRLPVAELITNAGDPDGAVLPGSSLRGALHAHADRIAATLGRPKIACRLFGFAHDDKDEGRQGLVRVSDGKPQGTVRKIWLDHVAIDRITGFAADAKLFNTWALASPKFQHQLLLRWHRGDEEAAAAVALMLFVLRDAEQGLLWVGSRTTRGYGYLKGLSVVKASASLVSNQGRDPFAFAGPTSIGALAAGELKKVIGPVLESWRDQCGIAAPAEGEAA